MARRNGPGGCWYSSGESPTSANTKSKRSFLLRKQPSPRDLWLVHLCASRTSGIHSRYQPENLIETRQGSGGSIWAKSGSFFTSKCVQSVCYEERATPKLVGSPVSY